MLVDGKCTDLFKEDCFVDPQIAKNKLQRDFQQVLYLRDCPRVEKSKKG